MASYKGVAECAICCGGSNSQRWSALECGHVYHQDCLDKWLVHKRDCPNCRVTMSKRKRPLELFLSSVADAGEADVPELLAERDAQVQELQDSKQQLQESLEEALAAAAHAFTAAGTLQDQVTKQEAQLKEDKQKREALRCRITEEVARSTAAARESNSQLELFKMHLQKRDNELRLERVKHQRVQEDLTNLRLMANPHYKLDGIRQVLGGSDKLVPAAVLAARNAELQAAHQRCKELETQLAAAAAEVVRQKRDVQERSRREVEAVEKQRDEAKRAQLRAEVTISNLQTEKEELQQQLRAALQQRQELQSVVRAVAGPQTVAAARASTAAAAAARVSSTNVPGSSGLQIDCWSQGPSLSRPPQQQQQPLQQLQQQQAPCSQAQSQRGSTDRWAGPVSTSFPQQIADCSTLNDIGDMVPETKLQEEEGAMSSPQRQWVIDEGPSTSSPFAAPASFLGKASAASSHFQSTTGSFIRKGPDGMGGTCTHLNVSAATAGASSWRRSDQVLGVVRPQVQQQLGRQWAGGGAAKKPSKPLAVSKTLTKPKAQPITRFFGAGAR